MQHFRRHSAFPRQDKTREIQCKCLGALDPIMEVIAALQSKHHTCQAGLLSGRPDQIRWEACAAFSAALKHSMAGQQPVFATPAQQAPREDQGLPSLD